MAPVAVTPVAQSPLVTTAGRPDAACAWKIFFCIAWPHPSADRIAAEKVSPRIRHTTSSPLLLIQL